MRREFRQNRPAHAQAGMAGPERARLVADAIAKATMIDHRRMAQHLLDATPEAAHQLLEQARKELARMQGLGTYPRFELGCWESILAQPVHDIAAAMVSDQDVGGPALRSCSPWKRAI